MNAIPLTIKQALRAEVAALKKRVAELEEQVRILKLINLPAQE